MIINQWHYLHQVIFPAANKKDYDELSNELKAGLSPHFVSHFDEVFKLALEYDGPTVVPKKEEGVVGTTSA